MLRALADRVSRDCTSTCRSRRPNSSAVRSSNGSEVGEAALVSGTRSSAGGSWPASMDDCDAELSVRLDCCSFACVPVVEGDDCTDSSWKPSCLPVVAAGHRNKLYCFFRVLERLQLCGGAYLNPPQVLEHEQLAEDHSVYRERSCCARSPRRQRECWAPCCERGSQSLGRLAPLTLPGARLSCLRQPCMRCNPRFPQAIDADECKRVPIQAGRGMPAVNRRPKLQVQSDSDAGCHLDSSLCAVCIRA